MAKVGDLYVRIQSGAIEQLNEGKPEMNDNPKIDLKQLSGIGQQLIDAVRNCPRKLAVYQMKYNRITSELTYGYTVDDGEEVIDPRLVAALMAFSTDHFDTAIDALMPVLEDVIETEQDRIQRERERCRKDLQAKRRELRRSRRA